MTERLDTPENVRDALPIIIVPGWAESPSIFTEVTRRLEEQGRSATVFESTNVTLPDGVVESSSALNKEAAALLSVVQRGEVAVDVIAHSKGAIVAALAAEQNPELFHALILVNPAGMVENDSLLALGGRFLQKSQDLLRKAFTGGSLSRQRIVQLHTGAAASIARNPSHSVKEALELPQTNITQLLRKAHDQGVKIAIVHSVDDKAFPMNQVQEGGMRSDFVDGFLSVTGVHDNVWLDPEQYGVAVEETLAKLS